MIKSCFSSFKMKRMPIEARKTAAGAMQLGMKRARMRFTPRSGNELVKHLHKGSASTVVVASTLGCSSDGVVVAVF